MTEEEKTLHGTRDRVLAFCRQAGLLAPGQQVAAAVSGGADSMALLRLLLDLAGPLGIRVSACHVNHRLRGAAADADEAFVRAQCAGLGVPLRVFRAGEEGLPSAAGGEAEARALRYACFARLHREGIDRVATAHTVSDQAETLLFRLARGTGLHGAGGIPPGPGFLRPAAALPDPPSGGVLLQGLPSDMGHRRDQPGGRLCPQPAAPRRAARFAPGQRRRRGKSGPLLREGCPGRRLLCPGCPGAAGPGRSRLAGSLGPGTSAPGRPSDPGGGGPRSGGPAPGPPRRFISGWSARRWPGAPERCSCGRMCGCGPARAASGWRWRRGLLPDRCSRRLSAPKNSPRYPLGGGKTLSAQLVRETFQEKTQVVHKKDLKNVADYARITMLHPALTLRSRQPGDTYRPAGRGVTKSLRKWMNEQAIPPWMRDSLPLLADGSQVVWVCGAGFAEGLAPDGAARPCPAPGDTTRKGEQRGC